VGKVFGGKLVKYISFEIVKEFAASFLEKCEKSEESTGSILWGVAKETARTFSDGILSLPTIDAEKVVHCRECSYFEAGKDFVPYCNHIHGMDAVVADAYCSYGEQKETE
jgi:hypothetical protein